MKNKVLGNEVKKLLIDAIDQYLDERNDENIHTEQEEWFISAKFILEYIYNKNISEFFELCEKKKNNNRLIPFLEVNL